MILKSKYLVNKGCKKNIHRWKLNSDRGKTVPSASSTNKYTKTSSSLLESGLNSRDDEKIKQIIDQKNQTEQQMENIRMAERMNELRFKLELTNTRKKQKLVAKKAKNLVEQHDREYEKLLNEPYNEKFIQRQQKRERYLSAETKMKIKANLIRNRSLKAINSSPTILSSSLISSPKVETSLESISKGRLNADETGVTETVLEEEFGTILHLNTTFTKARPKECQRNERMKANAVESYEKSLLPKIHVREDSSFVSEIAPLCFGNSKKYSSDEACAENRPSTESLIECYDQLSSSSTSSLVSYQPKNRFYHSDLDLNQLSSRFRTKLSLSNQGIESSEQNNLAESMLLFEENCVKWAELDYKVDEHLQTTYDTKEDSEVCSKHKY